MRLGRLLQRQRDDARAAGGEHRGRHAFVDVADHDAAAGERDLVGETVDVAPVEREQQIEGVVERLHRAGCQAQQRRRLAAADLRPAGAHHQAVQTGARRGVEQHRARRHHAAAAAAGDGDRQAAVGTRRRRNFGVGSVQRHRSKPLFFDASQWSFGKCPRN
ncbi:MAG: hypothetical protein U1E90_00955 [Burkholderiaceae bacterium]